MIIADDVKGVAVAGCDPPGFGTLGIPRAVSGEGIYRPCIAS